MVAVTLGTNPQLFLSNVRTSARFGALTKSAPLDLFVSHLPWSVTSIKEQTGVLVFEELRSHHACRWESDFGG